MLTIAALLLFLTGLAHSYLGERYILIRLFKRDNLPKLFGGTDFTTGTLRFVWHLLTLVWWGISAIVLLASGQNLDTASVLRVFSIVALVSGLLPLYFTGGRHLSWIIFFTVGALLWLGSFRMA
ncbi:hypothetical protein [Duganella sp. CF458]|uniref:hypothetical protein n=1 Tax=Duganella sp. CF458 TaxID=1884368 RepID=UPI000B864EF5|nr:hypothetical protein [Duganella sp. CF458]